MGFNLGKAIGETGKNLARASGGIIVPIIKGRQEDKKKEQAAKDAELAANNEKIRQQYGAEGQGLISQLYGPNAASNAGKDVQDVIKRRRELLDKPSPTASAIRASAARSVGNIREAAGSSGAAISGGLAAEQMRRQGSVQGAQAEYEDYLRNLGQFQQTAGKVASQIPSIDLAYRGLGISGQTPQLPQQFGMFDSVICTLMRDLGYMSDEMWEKDQAYGATLVREKPEVYVGYYYLAVPVVDFCRKHKWAAKLISYPAMAWARNMAGDKNLLGATISYLGEKLCGFYGRNLLGVANGKV